jgi:hypothetical protein
VKSDELVNYSHRALRSKKGEVGQSFIITELCVFMLRIIAAIIFDEPILAQH